MVLLANLIDSIDLAQLEIIVAIIVAILGVLINWYYRNKTYKIDEKRNDAEISALKKGKIKEIEETDGQ